MSPATVRGSTQLLFDCIRGVSKMVEGMHNTIATSSTSWLGGASEILPVRAMRKPPAYPIIQHVSGHLGTGVAGFLNWRQGQVDQGQIDDVELGWVAALNGICGDHLEATGNALALPMRFVERSGDREMMAGEGLSDYAHASPNIVVLVHGLCLSDQNWSARDSNGLVGPDLGQQLLAELGLSPVYLRYNSGRHISTNGRELAEKLDELVANWPVPVESISLVGHSMGGLVLRSACWYADQEQRPWLKRLQRILFLGTPHHGSPLEKAGHAFDVAMRSIKYVAPLMIGNRRSAGIKDLRYGNLLDEDWQNADQDGLGEDSRQVVPLLPEVDYFLAAATIGNSPQDVKGYLLGDMLVRVGSARGSHPDRNRSLGFKDENCRVFPEKDHFDLLSDERVHRQVIRWFNS